jgi:hypothetical protein
VQDRFYELDFKNKNKGTSYTTNIIQNETPEQEEVDLDKYVTKSYLKSSLNEYVTKRSWKDVKETTSMLQKSLLEGFTEGISPITVNTMQVVVGSDQLQYDFIRNYNNDEVISGGFVTEGDEEVLTTYSVTLKEGWIKHHTLDGPNTVRAKSEASTGPTSNRNELLTQYCRWHIAENEFELTDGSYYVYIKVPNLSDISPDIKDGYPQKAGTDSYYFSASDKTHTPNPITHTEAEALFLKTNAAGAKSDNTSIYPNAPSLSNTDGEYVLSRTAIEMDSEAGYYYLLFAIINSADDDGSRSYTTMNGFTEITPGRVTAYRFMSPDGIQYLNFIDKSMHLGDANSYIHFDADEQKFYIKGTIVQSPAGDEFPIPCYRGVFTEEQIKATTNRPIFYYGDSITFEGST